MGRQVNFFLHKNDQEDFDKYLKSFGDLALIPYYHYDNKVSTVDDTLIRDFKKDGTRIYLVRPQDIGSVKLQHIAKLNYWLVDDASLPVMHFDRSIFKGNTIESGRLYFQSNYVKDSEWRNKPDDFIKWADRIINTTRRKLKKYKHHLGNYTYTEYLGAYALKWLESNKAEVRSGGTQLIATL